METSRTKSRIKEPLERKNSPTDSKKRFYIRTSKNSKRKVNSSLNLNSYSTEKRTITHRHSNSPQSHINIIKLTSNSTEQSKFVSDLNIQSQNDSKNIYFNSPKIQSKKIQSNKKFVIRDKSPTILQSQPSKKFTNLFEQYNKKLGKGDEPEKFSSEKNLGFKIRNFSRSRTLDRTSLDANKKVDAGNKKQSPIIPQKSELADLYKKVFRNQEPQMKKNDSQACKYKYESDCSNNSIFSQNKQILRVRSLTDIKNEQKITEDNNLFSKPKTPKKSYKIPYTKNNDTFEISSEKKIRGNYNFKELLKVYSMNNLNKKESSFQNINNTGSLNNNLKEKINNSKVLNENKRQIMTTNF